MLKLKKISVFTPLLFGLLLSLGTEAVGMAGPSLGFMAQPTYSSSKKYTCFFCNEGRDYAPALLKHIQLKHPEHNVIACPFCLKLFKDISSWSEHAEQEHSDNLYTCVYCPLKLRKKDELVKHVLNGHKNIKTYVCEKCSESYATQGDVHNHEQVCKHQGNLKWTESLEWHDDPLPLQDTNILLTSLNADSLIADEGTTNTVTLRTPPVESVKVGTIKRSDTSDCAERYRFFCDIKGCSKSYSSKQGLSRHKKSFHRKIRFACNIEGCNKTYSGQYELNRHKKKAHVNKPAVTISILREPRAEQLPIVIEFDPLIEAILRRNDTVNTSDCGKQSRPGCEVQDHDKNHSSKSGLKSHNKIHAQSSQPAKQVSVDFKRNSLIEHILKNGSPCDEPLPVDIENNPLVGHILKKNDTTSNASDYVETRYFACCVEGCTKLFNKKSDLENHLKSDHRIVMSSFRY